MSAETAKSRLISASEILSDMASEIRILQKQLEYLQLEIKEREAFVAKLWAIVEERAHGNQ